MTNLERIRAENREREYDELRARAPGLFRMCVQAAVGIMLRHPELSTSTLSNDAHLRIAADIEQALVSIAVQASEVPR